MPDTLLGPGKTEFMIIGHQVIIQNWPELLLSDSPSQSQVGTATIHCDPFISTGHRSFI